MLGNYIPLMRKGRLEENMIASEEKHREIVEELVSTSNPSMAYAFGLIHMADKEELDE